jgi:hypothetical protein
MTRINKNAKVTGSARRGAKYVKKEERPIPSDAKCAEFWGVMLAEDPETGMQLRGLVESTCLKFNIKTGMCARLPHLYRTLDDLTHFVMKEMLLDDSLAGFDSSRSENVELSGYLAWQTRYILGHELQDRERALSVDKRGSETEEMLRAGETYPRYSRADHCAVVQRDKDSEGKDTEITFGSQSKDWSSSCYWDASEPESPERSSVFAEGLMDLLDAEERKIIAAIMTHDGNQSQAAQSLGLTAAQVRETVKVIRQALRAEGIDFALMRDGGMV